MSAEEKILRAFDVLNAASGTTRLVEVGFMSSSHLYTGLEVEVAWKNGVEYAIDILGLSEEDIKKELNSILIENVMIPDDNMFAERMDDLEDDE